MGCDNDLILNIKGLTVIYETEDETVRAVTDLDLNLKKGKVLGIVGETGAGKTTTALAILRLISDPPGLIKSGTIMLDGMDIMSLPDHKLEKIRGKEVSMIFQDPMTSLNPVFTVGEQIAESISLHENLDPTEAYRKAQKMLEMVGIPANRSTEYPHQFSGGMKQRVMIAIALACSPKLLIADEPTTALDVTIQAQVLKLMKELISTQDTSLIMITHDLGIVAQICDEVAVMYAGRIVEKGTLEDIFKRTMHPYTEGLFNSLPNIKNRQMELKPIPGLMPDPTNLPDGCAFAPRCIYATERCTNGVPKSKMVSPTHMVTCSAYDDDGFSIERSRDR